MGQKEVYTNNIKSPSRSNNLLVQELFGGDYQSPSFFADAVSCFKVKDSTKTCNGMIFEHFVIEFWNEKSTDLCSIFQVVIHAPSRWSSDHFVEVLAKVSVNHKVLSLINGYYISGYRFSFVTINNLHHHFTR
jgi:hypothetical protein